VRLRGLRPVIPDMRPLALADVERLKVSAGVVGVMCVGWVGGEGLAGGLGYDSAGG